MKVIIAGCRDFHDEDFVREAIEQFPYQITEVVSGGADGVDSIGEDLADEHGVPVKFFVADWTTHGKRAGPIRNEQMGAYADQAIVIFDGQSKETKSMLSIMKKLGKPVHVHIFEREMK